MLTTFSGTVGGQLRQVLLYFNIFLSDSAAPLGLWPSRTTRFLDHTQRRATFGRTPLDEWSARRNLYIQSRLILKSNELSTSRVWRCDVCSSVERRTCSFRSSSPYISYFIYKNTWLVTAVKLSAIIAIFITRNGTSWTLLDTADISNMCSYFISGKCGFYMDELRSHYNRPISCCKAIESCALPAQYIYKRFPWFLQ
jgi:hypothetical protein